jgi:PadR family transcriptional regulator PadR
MKKKNNQIPDNKSNFLRGVIDLLILALLDVQDCYGYQLSSMIEEYSDEMVEIPVATLYQPLYRLKNRGYVSEREEKKGGRNVTYYHLESSGREYYQAMRETYLNLNKGIQNVLDVSQKMRSEQNGN